MLYERDFQNGVVSAWRRESETPPPGGRTPVRERASAQAPPSIVLRKVHVLFPSASSGFRILKSGQLGELSSTSGFLDNRPVNGKGLLLRVNVRVAEV